MSAPKLAEGQVTQVISHIQANIGAALDSVAAGLGSTRPSVSLENIKSYFVFEKAQGYELPAIFVILPTLDFRIAENASNFINAVGRLAVVAWVEDQDEESVTYKAWRYQSALWSVLDQADIVSSDNKLKIKPVVSSAEFSNTQEYVSDQGAGQRFRKAVLLKCNVEHLENYA